MDKHYLRTQDHLIDLIRNRNDKTPNFAVLIGAGASSSSGIKTASQMIHEWRNQLYKHSKSKEAFETWIEKQDWYTDEEEYSILFEKLYDEPGQRRNYIEECVKNAKLGWGYIYLANIISNNFFNVTFTPNFDDLINEACCLYADLKPMVCAHDSQVAGIRIISTRPKIIKLHGDFLYDTIKNTLDETKNLEENMREKFLQFLHEYGLIVIGYGGNDRSIMDILDSISASDEYLPHGLYWCLRKEDKPSKKLERLIRRGNVYCVEIEGFDDFMAELHSQVGLALPAVVSDPYKATTERINTFISVRKEIKHPIIIKDIKELDAQVRKFEQAIVASAHSEEFDRLVPYRFLGDQEYLNKNYEAAIAYYKKALMQDPLDLVGMNQLVESYLYVEKIREANNTSDHMISCKPDSYLGYTCKANVLVISHKEKEAIKLLNTAFNLTAENTTSRFNVLLYRSNVYLLIDEWNKALSDTERSLKIIPSNLPATINRCIALKKLKGIEEIQKTVKEILKEKDIDSYLRACAYSLLDDKKNMLIELSKALKEDRAQNRYLAKSDPDFKDYREDEEFKKLIKGK